MAFPGLLVFFAGWRRWVHNSSFTVVWWLSFLWKHERKWCGEQQQKQIAGKWQTNPYLEFQIEFLISLQALILLRALSFTAVLEFAESRFFFCRSFFSRSIPYLVASKSDSLFLFPDEYSRWNCRRSPFFSTCKLDFTLTLPASIS